MCPWLQLLWQRCLSQAHRLGQGVLILCVLLVFLGHWGTFPALAGINDDRYDGSIFTLYASNGALVPPKVNLAASLKKHRPALLMFYVDDSRECKQNALIVTQLQAFYRNTVSMIPINVDTIRPDKTYAPREEGYYYNGSYVPQMVLFSPDGDVVFNGIGEIPYEPIDDQLREIFDLPPRPESFSIERPPYSPSPSADTTFWTAPMRMLDQ